MTVEFYLLAITALLPLTAVMLVLQVNPYQALVMRGILGAIAALVYALFGAADVALTEALVGTMLSITLYAVAVRSSMEMRLGWVEPQLASEAVALSESASRTSDADSLGLEAPSTTATLTEAQLDAGMLADSVPAALDDALITALRDVLKPHHLRLEVLTYPNPEALNVALETKRIHTALLTPEPIALDSLTSQGSPANIAQVGPGPYLLQTRIKRLYEVLSSGLPASVAEISYLDLAQKSAAIAPPASQSPLTHSAQESP